MPREIKAPEAVLSVEKSFDGKHEIQFNERSHRYKWTCPCHLKAPSVGTTTFIKAAYPTSVGLTNWMKSQSVEALFRTLAKQSTTHEFYVPNETVWPITVEKKKEILRTATLAHEDVAQEAADIGTVVHAYCEYHSLGKLDKVNSLIERVKPTAKWPIINGCIEKYLAWDREKRGKLFLAESLIASPSLMFCGKIDRLDTLEEQIVLRDYKTSKAFYVDQFIQLMAYRIAFKEWLNVNISYLELVRFGKEDSAFETKTSMQAAEELGMTHDEFLNGLVDQVARLRHTYQFIQNFTFDWKKK